MPTVPFLRRLVLLFVGISGAAAAQTVPLEPARIDGNPLFSQSTTSFSGRVMADDVPPGTTLPVALDSVRHALIGIEGTPDTLVVVVGQDAGGAQRIFAGPAGAALVAVVTDSTKMSLSGRPLNAVPMTTSTGSDLVFDVSLEPGQSFLLFRRLDAQVGQADFGGTMRTVALMREPASGAFAVGPDLSVLVDMDGDGVLTSSSGMDGQVAEAHATSDPFRVDGRAYRVASVAADGSAVTFEPAPDDAEALAVGFRMPDLELERLDGTPVRLSDLRGQIVVLNWWADFCAPCYAEMPSLSTLAASHADDPRIAFVAIARNTREELQAALVGRTFGYQQTTAGEDAEALLGGGFPRHVILDADGRVVFDMLGGSANIDEMLGRSIDPLLVADE